MARPTRQGIDYFPYDVDLDQDDKLGMIIAEFGFRGELLYTKLCAWIYKTNGYYTEWNEDVQLKFLGRYKYCGFSMSFINEVVPRCVKWDLFDKNVFNAFHILTSSRIQSTWLEASRKRKERIINEKIWLKMVSSADAAEETQENPEETTQSKVKESKKKKVINGENGVAVSPPKKGLEEKQGEMKQRQQELYNSLVPYVQEYGKEMIRDFFDYWSEPNKSGTKFKKEMQTTWDLKLRLVTWEKNQYRFNKGVKKDEPKEPNINEKLKAAGKKKEA